MDVVKQVKAYEDDIIKYRRDLHRIPEVALDLPKTVKYVTETLKSFGIEHEVYEDISAVVGTIRGRGEGKTIGIRADMDALPITEETGLEFASTNQFMHACGHDAHTAMLLGAARVLQENSDSFKGNIRLLFQPGEEYPGGAKPMIERGALKDPDVDAVIGLHAGIINPNVPKGHIGIAYGPLMASMDRFFVKVIGKGGHGAYPENTIDSVSIACEIVNAINRIVSREVSATEPAVLSVTRIDGGFNQNILPDTVEIEGTARATNEEVREYMARRIEEIAKGIAGSFGAKIEYEYNFKYPVLINDIDFTEFFKKSALKILPEDGITTLTKPIMGGEDMAEFLRVVPGTFFFLSNPKLDENPIPHHNARFDLDESYLYLGSSLFVQTALDFLND
ncbi:M20 metallopeptidase family protein [Microaceticoccus formicicus]|uniref:M20 metallopeptidase family protein n=1 Tax=Microaceticoccus formicicus TaxID=3118105 RepID=UPI003CD048F4|nr:M20 family metallopeptidase [Peptoniphilaceae bacterium AMB_02]